jgi:hypothetical protein
MTKDLLRAFGKASAMNAFPSGQKIEISIVADQWWNEYAAPADGFVFVSGETHGGQPNSAVTEVVSSVGSASMHSYGTAKVTIPVRKGETVRIAARGELGVYAGFIPAKAST